MIKFGVTEVGETDDWDSEAAWRERSRGESDFEDSG